MAKVVVLVPDLLFGSKVQAMLTGAGHEVELCPDEDGARSRAPQAAVLVVDLASGGVDGAALVASMHEAGELSATRTLGFYSHVDQETRARAEQAGFDVVVPRSRMAREGGRLVERLLTA